MAKPYLIEDDESDHTWHFVWSDMWGPLVVTERGAEAAQPSHKSRFWAIATIWFRQGKRAESRGSVEIAIWQWPPTATERVRQLTKRSFLSIGFEAPEGYDPDFSKVIQEIVA